MGARMNDLLLEASKCFDKMESPFSSEWLGEHGVTLDEAGTLSENIGNAIRMWVRARPSEKVDSLATDIRAGLVKL